MRFVSLAAVLFVFWLLLSGHYTPFLIGAGALVAIAMAGFGYVLGYIDEEGHPIELTLRGLLYWPWLIKEILVSAVKVAWVIVHPSLPISPRLIEVETPQEGSVGLVTYANSITLTPGTITTGVDGDVFTVHALQAAGADDLEAGGMDAKVSAFEEGNR